MKVYTQLTIVIIMMMNHQGNGAVKRGPWKIPTAPICNTQNDMDSVTILYKIQFEQRSQHSTTHRTNHQMFVVRNTLLCTYICIVNIFGWKFIIATSSIILCGFYIGGVFAFCLQFDKSMNFWNKITFYCLVCV